MEPIKTKIGKYYYIQQKEWDGTKNTYFYVKAKKIGDSQDEQVMFVELLESNIKFEKSLINILNMCLVSIPNPKNGFYVLEVDSLKELKEKALPYRL